MTIGHSTYLDALPFAALVRRETVALLRLHTTVVPLAILLIAVFLLVAFGLSTESARNLTALAGWSRDYFITLLALVFTATMLFVPLLAGASIVSELEDETVELLALTFLGPAHLVLAKLVASIAYVLLLFAGMVPAAAVAFFQVGLDAALIVKGLTLIVVMTVSVAAAGIWISAASPRKSISISLAYVAMLGLLGAPYILAAIAIAFMFQTRHFDDMMNFSVNLFPPMHFMALVGGGATALSKRMLFLDPYIVCCGTQLLLAAFFLWRATARMRRRWQNPRLVNASPDGPHFDGIPIDSPRGRTRTRFQHIALVLARMDYNAVINPDNAFSRRLWHTLAAGSLLASGAFAIVAYRNPNEYLDALQGWLMLQLAVGPFIVLPFFVSAMCSERETGTLDGIRMSLISARTLVTAKAAAAITIGAYFLSAILPAQAIQIALTRLGSALLAGRPDQFTAATDILMLLGADLTMMLILAVAAVVSFLAASLGRRVTFSLGIGLGTMLFLLFGIYAIVIAVAESTGYYGDNGKWNVPSVCSPITAFGNLANSIRHNRVYLGVWTSSLFAFAILSAALGTAGARLYARRYMRD